MMRLRILTTLILIFFLQVSYSQLDSSTVDSLMRVYIDTGYSGGFTKFKPNTLPQGQIFSIYSSYFADDSLNSFEPIDTIIDEQAGYRHTRYQQYYKGIEIEGAEFWEHSYGGYVDAISGFFANPDKDTTGSLALWQSVQALDTSSLFDGNEQWSWLDPIYDSALQDETGVEDTSYFPTNRATQVWYYHHCTDSLPYLANSCLKLAWRVELYCIEPNFFRAYYVDAFSGNVIDYEDLDRTDGPATDPIYGSVNIDTKARGVPHNDFILHAKAYSRNVHTKNYESGTFGNGPAPFIFVSEIDDDDDDWGTSEEAATSVHYYATWAWDYFADIHQYDGYNGSGKKCKILADGLSGDQTTYFSTSNMLMVNGYQDASSPVYRGVMDIVSHEFSHGVTYKTAKFKYKGESGALDEGYCDVFGTLVERHAESQLEGFNWDWTYGEDAPVAWGERSLIDPTSSGAHINPNIVPCGSSFEEGQPDTYDGEFWYDPDGECDEGGVHVNSGVFNKWFYLLSAGGGHNDVTTIGIGPDRAADIAFFALKHVLVRKSTFTYTRLATMYAAALLYGECSIEFQSVSDAWDAVGVPGPASECYPQGVVKGAAVEVNVYPNPSSGSIFIEARNSAHLQVDVFSIEGRKIWSQWLSDKPVSQLDFSLPSGIYIFRFTNGFNTATRRIVVGN